MNSRRWSSEEEAPESATRRRRLGGRGIAAAWFMIAVGVGGLIVSTARAINGSDRGGYIIIVSASWIFLGLLLLRHCSAIRTKGA